VILFIFKKILLLKQYIQNYLHHLNSIIIIIGLHRFLYYALLTIALISMQMMIVPLLVCLLLSHSLHYYFSMFIMHFGLFMLMPIMTVYVKIFVPYLLLHYHYLLLLHSLHSINSIYIFNIKDDYYTNIQFILLI
jgi:hypothetical protein